jgi:hypothetical protein
MTAPARTPWPFDDPENVAVLTTRGVMLDHEPIVFVLHDDDDGSWQFLCARGASVERAMLVALHEMVQLDATVAELADLPRGWQASRAGPGAPWIRGPQSSFAAEAE